ncbi:hypothetical protein QQ045_005932 [Rhodiola kirilowii]
MSIAWKPVSELLPSKRSCFPKLEAIKSATADILTGLRKKDVTLTWKGKASTLVEISGLDIGWGQVINDERTSSSAALRTRLMGDDPDLTKDERVQIREFLEAFPDEE